MERCREGKLLYLNACLVRYCIYVHRGNQGRIHCKKCNPSKCCSVCGYCQLSHSIRCLGDHHCLLYASYIIERAAAKQVRRVVKSCPQSNISSTPSLPPSRSGAVNLNSHLHPLGLPNMERNPAYRQVFMDSAEIDAQTGLYEDTADKTGTGTYDYVN